jgi:hypothetical protein
MPGCCLIALLLFFGPRVVLALAWIFTNWYSAFDSTLVALAGFIFLPWTSLAWMYTFFENGGRIGLIYGALIAVALVADIGAYSGGRRWREWKRR